MRHNFSLLALSVASFVLAAHVSAEEGPGAIQNPKAPVAESNPVSKDYEVLRTNCYTDARDCSGTSYWKNNNARGIGCSIWWNNGAAGRTNFVLGPGQSQPYSVRFNDTYSCVWIEQAPPSNSDSRSYIWVP